MASKEELLKSLSDCVVQMEDEMVVPVAEEYIQEGYPAINGILHGLVDVINKAADLFEKNSVEAVKLVNHLIGA